MTKFNKALFQFHGGYLTYPVNGQQMFIARFKYVKGNRAGFQAFLIKNFTVEEYISARVAANGKEIAPACVLEAKGYIPTHIKKWLKEGGYPVTQAGRKQFTADQHALFAARGAAYREAQNNAQVSS